MPVQLDRYWLKWPLLHPQCLIEQLREMIQYGDVAGHQGGPSRTSCVLQVRSAVRSECNDRNVLRFRILSEHGDDVANIVPAGDDVRQHNHRILLLGARHQRAGIRDGTHAVFEVLEPVHQLGSRQQFLIHDKRQGLRHAQENGMEARKMQKVSTAPFFRADRAPYVFSPSHRRQACRNFKA